MPLTAARPLVEMGNFAAHSQGKRPLKHRVCDCCRVLVSVRGCSRETRLMGDAAGVEKVARWHFSAVIEIRARRQ